MNNLIKLGVAGGLALGSLAANASISVGSTSGTYGDAVLFADIYNGTTLVSAYVGDTGATVNSLAGGTAPTTYDPANLQTFLSNYSSGDTIYWSVEGAGSNSSQAPTIVTSANSTVPISGLSGANLKGMIEFLNSLASNNLDNLVGNGTDYVGNDVSSIDGTEYEPITLVPNAANWHGATTSVATTGLGTSVTLYSLTATNYQAPQDTLASSGLKVSLTSSGLVYSTATAVPVPAAVWLLGSGLLGLAGVARRKITVA
jgi:hypothetical protein